MSLLMGVVMSYLCSCDKTVTYAEQKAREKRSIERYIERHNIEVISMEEFLRDTITNNSETGPDFTKNEYVLFSETGIYLQIVRRGTGRAIESGERWDMTARYSEYNILSSDTLTLNTFATYTSPDRLWCSRDGDTYRAGFLSGVMFSKYGSAVPKGWISILPYIKPGFLSGISSSKVRIIVPHSQGTQKAATSVYPTFYEITIKPEKWQ